MSVNFSYKHTKVIAGPESGRLPHGPGPTTCQEGLKLDAVSPWTPFRLAICGKKMSGRDLTGSHQQVQFSSPSPHPMRPLTKGRVMALAGAAMLADSPSALTHAMLQQKSTLRHVPLLPQPLTPHRRHTTLAATKDRTRIVQASRPRALVRARAKNDGDDEDPPKNRITWPPVVDDAALVVGDVLALFVVVTPTPPTPQENAPHFSWRDRQHLPRTLRHRWSCCYWGRWFLIQVPDSHSTRT